MEIDLNKPLKTYIRKKKGWYKLEYEGLDLVCFDCGRFGHIKEGCRKLRGNESNEEPEMEKEQEAKV